MTTFKQKLLETIRLTTTVDALSPFISLLSLEKLKRTLTNHIENNMDNNTIRKQYYKRMNIETIMSLDLLCHILSFQSFEYLCKNASNVSKTIQKACNHTLNQRTNLTLFIDDGIIRAPSTLTFRIDVSCNEIFEISYNDLIQYNHSLQQFAVKHWHRFENIFIMNGDLNDIIHTLNTSLKNVKTLLYLSYYPPLQKITNGTNLQFICIHFHTNINIWNILIENCPILHGIVFVKQVDEEIDSNVSINVSEKHLLTANNLWLLKISNDVQYEFAELMVHAAPNLCHLSIDSYFTADRNHYSGRTLQLPQSLISLSIGTQIILHDISFDFNGCTKLIYLEIPLLIIQCAEEIRKLLISYAKFTKSCVSYLGIGGYTQRDVFQSLFDNGNIRETLNGFKNEMVNDMQYNDDNMKRLYVLTYKDIECDYGINLVEVMNNFATIVLSKPINNIQINQDCERQNILIYIAEKALSRHHEFVGFNRMLRKNGVSKMILSESTELAV